jgi:hypothetical protein
MAFAGPDHGVDVTTAQGATVKKRFKDGACFGRELTKPAFFIRPNHDPCPQAIRLHHAFHETHLIDAGR